MRKPYLRPGFSLVPIRLDETTTYARGCESAATDTKLFGACALYIPDFDGTIFTESMDDCYYAMDVDEAGQVLDDYFGSGASGGSDAAFTSF